MEKIYEILADMRPEFDFTQSQNFIEDGYLDSFDLVSLISALEEEFHVLIDALDIVPENFYSVETIAELVRKSGGALS